jgi:hypothetical protein
MASTVIVITSSISEKPRTSDGIGQEAGGRISDAFRFLLSAFCHLLSDL